VVDHEFVAAVGSKGGLDGAGDGAAGVDVAEDGAIFGIVTDVLLVERLVCLVLRYFLLLVAWFEEPAVWGVGYRE
jgi:hypothetical protein